MTRALDDHRATGGVGNSKYSLHQSRRLCLRVCRLLIVFCIALGFSKHAHAQRWAADRRYTEGIGIRTGDLELHPSLLGQFGYDSNVFRRADTEQPLKSLRLRITPALSLSTLSSQRAGARGGGTPPKLSFRAGLYAAYNEFIPLQEEQAATLRAQRDVGLGATFDLDVLPRRPWGFDVQGDFVRTIQPSNQFAGADLAFDRDSLRLGPGVTWRPGGGLFEWRVGYELMLTWFEDQAFQNFNNVQHTLGTRGRWKFLPRTALLYDGRYSFVRFTSRTDQNDGERLTSRIGIKGLVTKRFQVMALAGWGASFFTERRVEGTTIEARNYDDLVAHLEGRWFLMPQTDVGESAAIVGLSSIAAGYVRDFGVSYLGAFFRRDRGYVLADYYIGGRALIVAEAGLSHLGYPEIFFAREPFRVAPFSENRIDLRLFGEYRFSHSLGVNATAEYDRNISVTNMPVPGSTDVDNLEFERIQFYLGVRWFL